MRGFAGLLVLACVVVAAVVAPTPAWADDDFALPVPPPPPPPVWPDAVTPPRVDWTPSSPAAPQPAWPRPAPAPFPAPTAPLPVPVAPAPAAPAPAYGVTYERGACWQRRDECGWHTDWCGKRYGRVELVLEGSISLFDAPEGPFGGIETGLPDQMRWDELDYSDDLVKNLGGRATLRYAPAPRSVIELRGSFYGMPESEVRASGVYAFFPGPIGRGGVSDPNSALLTSEAQLFGGELNWWVETCCTCRFRWDLGVGVRYIQFNEKVTAEDWAEPFPGLVTPAFVACDATSRFLGGQVGIGCHLDLSDRIELSMFAKALVGHTAREIEVNDRSFFGPGEHEATSEDSSLTFGAEVEVSAKIRLAPWFALTLGYNVLFLPNVVRAHDGLDFTRSTSGTVHAAQRTDDLLVHTFFAGFGFTF